MTPETLGLVVFGGGAALFALSTLVMVLGHARRLSAIAAENRALADALEDRGIRSLSDLRSAPTATLRDVASSFRS